MSGSHNRNFLTVLESGSPRPGCWHGRVVAVALLGHILAMSSHGGEREIEIEICPLLIRPQSYGTHFHGSCQVGVSYLPVHCPWFSGLQGEPGLQQSPGSLWKAALTSKTWGAPAGPGSGVRSVVAASSQDGRCSGFSEVCIPLAPLGRWCSWCHHSIWQSRWRDGGQSLRVSWAVAS